jgi:NitT/TauT family transport system permease protein
MDHRVNVGLVRRAARMAPPVLLLIALLALWEYAGRTARSLLVPTASAAAASLAALAADPRFWSAWWSTHQAFLIGFAAAAALGAPLGLALGRWPALDDWLDLHLQLLLVTPMSAVMPFVILTLGLGIGARAVVVVVFAGPIIAATARHGVRAVDPRLIDMARAFGATEPQIWRRVLIPGSAGALVTALRLGLGRALAGMLSVELLLVAAGLGQLMLRFQADFDSASVYALALVLAAEAVVLTAAGRIFERRLRRRYAPT